jgi:hypothetical protein
MKTFIKNEQEFKDWKANQENCKQWDRCVIDSPEKYPCILCTEIEQLYHGDVIFNLAEIVYLDDFKEHIEKLASDLNICPSTDDEEAGYNNGIKAFKNELLK